MNKLKEINGRYYQECEVVMLATDKATWLNCIWLGRISNQLRLDTSYNNNPKSISPIDNSMLPQHLYFLSNEKIKEGDWFMNRQYMIEEGKEEYAIWRCGDITPNSNPKKIIATTDTSLTIIDYTDCEYPLPQPSKEFIQAYIKAYNKGKPITKVLIEMHISKINYKGEIKLLHFLNDVRGPIITSLIPKVNSSNEITIKKVKDSWTREEVIIDIEKAMIQGLDLGQYRDKWIEQNL